MNSSRASSSFVQDSNDDVSMAQIANARETFDDLESAYRKFKFELESVKGEHKSEVSVPCYLEYILHVREVFPTNSFAIVFDA